MTLNLAMVVSMDTAAAKKGTSETTAGVREIGTAAAETSRAMVAANDATVASIKRVTDALTGQNQAQLAVRQRIEANLGMREPANDGYLRQRQADLDAYGAALDDMRAKYVPLFAMERQHLQTLREIDQAAKLGAISEQERAAAVIRASNAYDVLVAAATRGGMATRLNAGEVQNLSFQVNDIAMMLMSGQSFGVIMAQQGMQVSQIFGRRGLGTIIPELASSLGSLITPTTMLLAGITAVGYAAGYAFEAMQTEVLSTDGVLTEHDDLIRRLKDAWGEAAQGPVAYARESKVALELLASVHAEERRELLRKMTPGAVSGVTAEVDVNQFGGARAFRENPAFEAIRREFEKLRAEAVAGVPDFVAFQRAMNELARTDPSPPVRKFAAAAIEATAEAAKLQRSLPEFQSEFDAAGASAAGAAAKVDQFAAALRRLYEGDTRSLSPREQLDRDYQAAVERARTREERDDAWRAREERRRRIEDAEAGAMVPTPTRRPNDIDRMDEEAASRASLVTGRERIEQLRAELILLGQGEAARTRFLAALEAEQDIRRRGIDSMGEEATAIRSQAAAIAELEIQLERQQDAWNTVQRAGERAIDGIGAKLRKGDWEGALEQIANSIAGAFDDLALENPLQNLLDRGNRPTLDDVGGIGGFFSRLLGLGTGEVPGVQALLGGGESYGTVNMSAAVVNLTGVGGESGAVSAITRLLGGTAANDDRFGLPGRTAPPALSGIGSPSTGASYGGDLAANIRLLASSIGAKPRDLAALMSFESGLNPDIWGGAGGRHYGLIQAGRPERATYGITPGGSLADQFAGIERYFKDRGFKPGMSGLDLYSTVNAGRPGLYNASDAANGGTWGTVADKWNLQMGPHFKRADQLLGKFADATGAATDGLSTAAKGLGEFGSGVGQLGNNLASAGPTGGGGGGGLFDWIARLFGGGAAWSPAASAAIAAGGGGLYDKGDYTGDGPADQVAGLAHKGEFYFSARATRNLGVGYLRALHEAGKRGSGFAEGGYAYPGGLAANNSGALAGVPWADARRPMQVVVNNLSNASVRVEEEDDGQGGRRPTIVVEEQMAGGAARRGSAFRRTMEQDYGLRPRAKRY